MRRPGRRAIVGCMAALGLFATHTEARTERRGGSLRPYADPAAVIGAEIAFNQLAQAKGQWTAFRATAARDAVMFVPQRMLAQDWLKGRPDPAIALRWQPHAVWSSCDGSYAVTRGAWQGSERTGFFVTVWQRQPKGRGYKWVLDIGQPLAAPLTAPEMIAGSVAECANRPARPGPATAAGAPPDFAAGQSEDCTLRWTAIIDQKGAGSIAVQRWTGSAYAEVLRAPITPG